MTITEQITNDEDDSSIPCYYCDHEIGNHDSESCFVCMTCSKRHDWFECSFNEQILACSECSAEWSFMDEPQDTMMDLNLPLELDCTSDEIEQVFTKPECPYSCPKCDIGLVNIHKQCSCDGQVYPEN